MSLLISADELAELRRGAVPVRLLDVRWRLDRPEGRPDYLGGHLPGAVYVDVERELSRKGEPEHGRHPLPSLEALQKAARGWGIRRGDIVVAYDDASSLPAARAWWLLRRSGIADVRVLDGGVRAWVDAGHTLHTGDVRPPAGDVILEEAQDDVLSMAAAAEWPERGVLIDARAGERYRGESETMDPIAGHIPGAINLPSSLFLEAGRFRAPAEIASLFARAGVADGVEVAAYCGSGITAAHTALAGALVGVDVRLYPGSWSQWSRTRGRDVATGPLPHGRSAER